MNKFILIGKNNTIKDIKRIILQDKVKNTKEYEELKLVPVGLKNNLIQSAMRQFDFRDLLTALSVSVLFKKFVEVEIKRRQLLIIEGKPEWHSILNRWYYAEKCKSNTRGLMEYDKTIKCNLWYEINEYAANDYKCNYCYKNFRGRPVSKFSAKNN